MADFKFTIPTNREDLLSGVRSDYTVKNVLVLGEIVRKLEEAGRSLRDEGVDFIIDNFDVYYSILYHATNLQSDVVFKAYCQLHKATENLPNTVAFLLDDKDSLTDEVKMKTVNVLKMLSYIYGQFVMHLEQKKMLNPDVGRNKARKDNSFAVDKPRVLHNLSNVIQREINLFWDPPLVEQDLIGAIAELCFSFLHNPAIKQEKEVRNELFITFGHLIKSHDYGQTFVARIIQSIRMYEHVVHCTPAGIKMIVEEFNCKGFIHHFVKEATEWQIDESFQDVQGTRCCSIFLTELAVIMPDLMIPEVMYLNQYLEYESQPLRSSILNVITEVILKVLSQHTLTEEEKESRDEFLDVIIEHIRDVSALVRAKVINNLTRLQQESAIPLSYQHEVLEKIIEHLYDKAAAVRKSAINYVATVLEHNPFGANLQLKKTEELLASKMELLNKLEEAYQEAKRSKIEELQKEWSERENDIRQVVEEQLEKNDDEEAEEELDKDQTVETIRANLYDKKYVEAFKLTRRLQDSIEEWKNMRKQDDKNQVAVYLVILQTFYMNAAKLTDELRTGAGMTAEDVKKVEALESLIKYLEGTTEFLRIIHSAIKPMKSLLFTQTASDMNEAIHFFVTAYKFQIDGASEGVLEMLKLMRYREAERKDAVVAAFKTIYLTTDSKNMSDHTSTILNRLIALLKQLTYEYLGDFQNIISEWTSKGILDNSVIGMCWQYFTKRESVSDDDARAAVEILRMAAVGRSTVITKNFSVVTAVMFSDEHKDDMVFLASCCRFLAVAGADKIDIQSKTVPLRHLSQDPALQTLSDIIVKKFFEKLPFYSDAMQAAVDCIFRICAQPMEVCEKILRRIVEKVEQSEKYIFILIRLCELLGCLAIKVLSFLDNTVYRELKRRNYVLEDRKENSKNNKNKNSKNKSSVNSTINENDKTATNASVLMGAEAEDTDAEFILNVLENDIVTSGGFLGRYSEFLLRICERPDVYDDIVLQQAAITATLRYMLVSSKFCQENIRIVFTIFENTAHPDIKCTILVLYSDLLTRFPNIVEPWSPKIYGMLKDQLPEVRKSALFALSNLILRDMIRAHSQISEMAACLIDENDEISNMCKVFFNKLAQKDNNLANVIPDIFSHLVRMDSISEDNLRYILKYLFELIDTSKRMESLVDRFCCKYTLTDDLKLNRNITYCLSLINYNDKALKKLHDKFPLYKHHVHDAEVYSMLKEILAQCSKTKVGKTDLKPIVTDIENCIASVFEINEDGQPAKRPPVPKSTKKPRGRRNKKKQVSDSEDESDDNSKTKKSRRIRSARSQNTASSDTA